MGLVSHRKLLSLMGFLALSFVITGCPEKGGADKTTAEPERPEVDDEGKADETKKAAPAAPAEVKKPDEDKGGW